MSQKLLYLTSFVLVLALAGANVALGVTVEVRTAGSHEGVEEHINGGSIARSSTDLEMPYEDSGPSDPQLTALRFQNVNVPPGAVIVNAYVQFLADSEKLTGGPVNLIIWGQKELNPGNFTSDTNFMVSTAPRTEAIAKWSDIPAWTSSEANLASRTSDISIVIQELIDQPGWASGDVLIIIIGDDPDNPSQSIRSAQSWDGNSVDAPLLHIEWARGPATFPSPEDGETDVSRNVVLSWTPGPYAAPINGHKVYLSESFNDVNDGIGGVTQSTTSYTPLQRLNFSTTYYWRVDEVNNVNTNSPWISRVWSFTTEMYTYPIDGNKITTTASSTGQEGMDPENTINGSGLDVNDLHSTEAADMWLSDDEPNAWIEYELDKAHKLHEMWVWNANQMIESLVGFGFKDVTIEYSTNGTDYTTFGTTHEFARAPGMADYAHNTTVDFGGTAAKYVRLTANNNWGGILKQYGLSEVRFFHIPVHATEPSPDSGAADVDIDVVLGFRAGREAVTHDVYLSTDEQAVIDGNAPVSTVTEASYSPLSLDLETTYYWKINEVNEAETTTTWQSDLWSFTTTDHIIVDDFEDYTDYPPDEIWFTWVDGYGVSTNGATVGYPDPAWNLDEHYAETTIVHGGDQAMPFFYSNTGGATHSEGERTFAVPQDWTAATVQTLALHFHGTAGNTGQLYVKINGTKVPYDGQASNLALAAWQAWNIDLASSGVSLQSVTTLTIGVEGNGASGTLYFDDFGLYALAPAPVSEWRITAGSDDAEEDVGGSASFAIDLTSTDLELMHDNNPADPLDEQVVGLRFVGIPIPKGSTITEAWVQFDADDVDDPEHVGNAYILIDGELNPAPVTFENTPNNITARPRTTAQVSWTSEPWPSDGGSHQKALTPDISSIIQEIVDQDGWSGSALVLIFSQDPANPSVGHRECESFNGAGNNIDQRPTLHITYQ